MPYLMLMLAGIIEFFGGLLLILGLFTRTVALIVFLEFVVIVLFIKLQSGFSNMELDLLMLAALLVVSCLGAGVASLPGIFKRRTRRHREGDTGGHGSEAMSG